MTTIFDQAIELTLYLTAFGQDLETAATIAEVRFSTPKQTIIDYIQKNER